jgi:hypothetical protein
VVKSYLFLTKDIDDSDWLEVSERDFHQELYIYVKQTTPWIKRMLAGKEVRFGYADFKIQPRD